VIVPVGLRLVPLTGSNARRLLRAATVLQPFGALAAIVSFVLPPGATAGGVAAAWFAVSGVAGLAGLLEIIEARSIAPDHLLPAVALGFLAVGAAWLVAFRSGFYLGYGPTVAELTAVHFHFAGFGAVLMSALAQRYLGSRLSAVAGWLVVGGTPLTAAGFALLVPALTVIGPILLATGLLTNAALTAFVIAPHRPTAARWLLTISSVTVVVPMLLGVDYAAARVFPLPALDLRTMAIVHGDLNAVVYVLLGLVGWSRA
jgi:YndJ-like protein